MITISYTTLILLCLTAISLIFGIIGVILGCYTLSKVIGMEKSSHSIQYMPAENVFSNEFKESRVEVGEGLDRDPFSKKWATTEKDLNKINAELKDDDISIDFANLGV